jgi:hypothetical protein
MPGPGQYNLKRNTEMSRAPSAAGGTSAFASKVVRANTAQAGEIRVHNGSRASKKVGHGFLRNAGRPSSTADLMGARPMQDVDVFEEEDADIVEPGPGHYYNPNVTSGFKVNVKDPALQRFGSSVDRFFDPFEAKTTKSQQNVGPGSYNVNSSKLNLKAASLHQMQYSGFTSSE